MTQKEIEKRIVTAVNIAIGDDGFRSKEVLEIFQQLILKYYLSHN